MTSVLFLIFLFKTSFNIFIVLALLKYNCIIWIIIHHNNDIIKKVYSHQEIEI
jgi:hypothetical protein